MRFGAVSSIRARKAEGPARKVTVRVTKSQGGSNLERLYRGDAASQKIEDDWDQPWVSPEWIRSFECHLSEQGKTLWKRLMSRGVSARDLIEGIALAVGSKDLGVLQGDDIEHANLVKDGLSDVRKLQKRLGDLKIQRKGALFVPSMNWPPEMEELERVLSHAVQIADAMLCHYKRMTHGSRNLDITEAFLIAVESIKSRFQIPDAQLAVLLEAGCLAAGMKGYTASELRERLRSAEKLYGKRIGF